MNPPVQGRTGLATLLFCSFRHCFPPPCCVFAWHYSAIYSIPWVDSAFIEASGQKPCLKRAPLPGRTFKMADKREPFVRKRREREENASEVSCLSCCGNNYITYLDISAEAVSLPAAAGETNFWLAHTGGRRTWASTGCAAHVEQACLAAASLPASEQPKHPFKRGRVPVRGWKASMRCPLWTPVERLCRGFETGTAASLPHCVCHCSVGSWAGMLSVGSLRPPPPLPVCLLSPCRMLL